MRFLIAMALLSIPGFCYGSDFSIYFKTCKTVAASFQSGEFKTTDGIQTVLECERHSKKLKCEFIFQDGSPARKIEYDLSMESGPLLAFGTPSGSEFVMVNSSLHSAVVSSRLLTEDFLGNKICSGIYGTESEIKMMKDAKDNKKMDEKKKK